MSDICALFIIVMASKKRVSPVRELNGYHCDNEVKDEDITETQPLQYKAEVPCSFVTTADQERSPAVGGARRERRVSNSSSGGPRIDSLKKNRPRMFSCFGANVSKLTTQHNEY